MSQKNRYIRHHQLKGFGAEAQKKLGDARVLIVGLGGLGLPVAQYLNAMGVGTLGLMDQDLVAEHNLQRQILYGDGDVGKSKTAVCEQRLQEQNPQTNLLVFDHFLSQTKALKIIENFDVIVDATDNFATRYLINDACVILNKPFVYGALHGFEGQVSVFNFEDGPTYRCLFPEMPEVHEMPNCDENGVLGVLPGIIGNLQALEVVKIITRVGEVLSGKLLLYDALTQSLQKISFSSKSENKGISKLQSSYDSGHCEIKSSLTASELHDLRRETLQIIDVRNPNEFEAHHLEGALNIPLNQLLAQKQQMDFERPIYLICQSGIRSQKALSLLKKRYPKGKIFHISGGMNEFMTV